MIALCSTGAVALLLVTSLLVSPSLARVGEGHPGQEVGPLIVGDEFELTIDNSGESAFAPVISEEGTKQNFKIKLREQAS